MSREEVVALSRDQKDDIRRKAYEFRLMEKRAELEKKFKSRPRNNWETEWYIQAQPSELPIFVATFEEACERYDFPVCRGDLTTKYEYDNGTTKIIMTQNFKVTLTEGSSCSLRGKRDGPPQTPAF